LLIIVVRIERNPYLPVTT